MNANTLLQSYRKATGQTSNEALSSGGIKITNNATSILNSYRKAIITPSVKASTTKITTPTPTITPTQKVIIKPNQTKLTQTQLKETFGQKLTKTISSINEKLGPILNKIYTPLQYQVEEIETGKKFKPTAGKIIGGFIEDAINAYIPVSGVSLKVPSETVKLSQRVISGVKSGTTFAGIHALIKAFKEEKIEPKELLVSGGIGAWIGFSSPTMMKDITKDVEISARKTLEDFGFKSKDFKNTEVLRSKFNKVAMELHPDKGGNAKDFQKFVEAYNKMTSAGIEPTWKLPDIKEWVSNLWKDAKKSPEEKAIIKVKAEKDFVNLVKSVIEKTSEKKIDLQGEKTPQEVINKVISSGIENTPQGKILIKQAVEAQKQGKNVVIEKPPVEGGVGYHSTDAAIKGNVIKAGSYSPQNYFGEGVYLGSHEGLYLGQNTYKVPIPENLKTLDLTKGNSAETFLSKVSKETGVPIEKTGMGVYEDLRMMASKSSDKTIRNAVDKITSGYEAIKSPLEYEGQYEIVIRKPELSKSVVEGGVEGVSPTVKKVSGGEVEKGVIKPQEVYPKAKIVSVPREQLPVGEGEKKVSKLEARVKGVVGKATEEQIKDLGLTTYKEMNKADQIAKASQYVVNNQQEALDVLRGKVEAPKGIIPESIYIAMTELAKDDLTLVTKLSTLQATALGQRISILSEIDKDNPVRLLNEVYKVRAKVVEKRYGKNAKENIKKSIKKQVKAPDKYDWSKFLDSIEC